MAKKTEKQLFNISELVKQLGTINGVDSIVLSEDISAIKVENWISTGNYALNALISGSMFKGIPEGKTCMISGASGCLHPKQKIRVYISKEIDKKQIKEE